MTGIKRLIFKKNKGFTLIEIVVAVTVFMIVVSSLTGFFLSAVQAQRKALALQELIDNTSYNLEYMSRAIRMAKKDMKGLCLTAKHNYEADENRIRFLNYQNKCQEFFLEQGQLKERKSIDHNAFNFTEPALALTPAGLEITDFRVEGSETWGQEQVPLTQPKVTIFLQVRGKGERPEAQPEIKVQTTISQRNLNVQY